MHIKERSNIAATLLLRTVFVYTLLGHHGGLGGGLSSGSGSGISAGSGSSASVLEIVVHVLVQGGHVGVGALARGEPVCLRKFSGFESKEKRGETGVRPALIVGGTTCFGKCGESHIEPCPCRGPQGTSWSSYHPRCHPSCPQLRLCPCLLLLIG